MTCLSELCLQPLNDCLVGATQVGEEVERAAMGGDEEDGASRVEVIHTNTIIEALPFVFWNLNL